MGKVQLKVLPWIANMLNVQGPNWLTLEQEITEGATIGDLLADLASNYTAFRKVVFNPDKREISGQVMIIINGSLLQFPDMTEAKLSDGDNIILMPVYSGG